MSTLISDMFTTQVDFTCITNTYIKRLLNSYDMQQKHYYIT